MLPRYSTRKIQCCQRRDSGDVYITGETTSSDLATVGAAQTSYTGEQTAAFAAKIASSTRINQYTHDGLQRLVGAVESPNASYAYSYDDAGNRLTMIVNGVQTQNFSYDYANQITNSGYTYDNAGNLTADGTTTYTYDALSRMTQRGSTTYTYNGDGTLVKQDAGGVTTLYTQDLASPLTQILQTKVGAATATDYVYGLNRLAALSGSTTTWYANDALGSVRRTFNGASATPLGIVNYDPWGTPESGSVPTFSFTGELQDATTGLVNLHGVVY